MSYVEAQSLDLGEQHGHEHEYSNESFLENLRDTYDVLRVEMESMKNAHQRIHREVQSIRQSLRAVSLKLLASSGDNTVLKTLNNRLLQFSISGDKSVGGTSDNHSNSNFESESLATLQMQVAATRRQSLFVYPMRRGQSAMRGVGRNSIPFMSNESVIPNQHLQDLIPTRSLQADLHRNSTRRGESAYGSDVLYDNKHNEELAGIASNMWSQPSKITNELVKESMKQTKRYSKSHSFDAYAAHFDPPENKKGPTTVRSMSFSQESVETKSRKHDRRYDRRQSSHPDWSPGKQRNIGVGLKQSGPLYSNDVAFIGGEDLDPEFYTAPRSPRKQEIPSAKRNHIQL